MIIWLQLKRWIKANIFVLNGKNLLTSQANLPEDVNLKIMQTAPYSNERPVSRSTKSMGFPIMNVVERENRLLASMDLVVPA